MAFTNGQNVQANDLNNFSVTTVTTTGDVTVGDDLAVTNDVTVGGDLAVTGSLTVGGVPISSSVARQTCCGRLSLTTGVPVTTSDVTAATTLYWALYQGNQIALYSGTEWLLFALSQLSIAVPATTNQMYDVFVSYNAGTPALALTAWTNDSTRATALTTQDGVLVKTGSTGQRYVGSFRTTAVSGQTEDSLTKRLVWNYYHRVDRPMRVIEGTNTWAYTTATWRQANGAAANQVAFVVGVAEDTVSAEIIGYATTSAGAFVAVAVGADSTSAPAAGNIGMGILGGSAVAQNVQASYTAIPAAGYHFWAWLEHSEAAGTTTWYGDNGGTVLQAGMSAVARG